jgi:hypothetical protein
MLLAGSLEPGPPPDRQPAAPGLCEVSSVLGISSSLLWQNPAREASRTGMNPPVLHVATWNVGAPHRDKIPLRLSELERQTRNTPHIDVLVLQEIAEHERGGLCCTESLSSWKASLRASRFCFETYTPLRPTIGPGAQRRGPRSWSRPIFVPSACFWTRSSHGRSRCCLFACGHRTSQRR